VAAILSTGLLLALGTLPWELDLRTDARAFQDGVGDGQLDANATVEYDTPSLRLRASGGSAVLLRETAERGTANFLGRGNVALEWQPDPRTQARMRQLLLVGPTDLSWIAYAPDTPLPLFVLNVGSPIIGSLNESTLTIIDHALTRSLHLSGSAGFAISGGFSARDQATLPQTRTAQAGGAVSWSERREALSLAIAGARGWISTPADTVQLSATGSWRHAFTGASELALVNEPFVRLNERVPRTRYETELTGGVAFLGGNGVGAQHGLVPTGGVMLRRDEQARRPGTLALRFTLRYAPVPDAATGTVLPRFEGFASADVRLARQWTFLARGSAGYAPNPDPSSARLLTQGGLGLAYEPVAGLVVSAMARVARIPQTEWAGVVTTTLTQIGRL